MLWEQPLKDWNLAIGIIRFSSKKDRSGRRVEGGQEDPQGGERETSEEAAVITGGDLSAEHTRRRGEREWRAV